MKNKLFVLAFILSVAVNVGVIVTLGYHKVVSSKTPPAYCINNHKMTWCSELELSEDQKKVICAQQKELKAKIEGVRKEIYRCKSELVNLLSEPQPDKTKIQSKITEVSSFQAQIQGIVIDNLIRHKEILTPVQQKKMLSLVSERMCPGNCLKNNPNK